MFPAYIVHSTPGRVRLRIPGKRGDAIYFAGLEAALTKCADVETVQVNVRAASVLITQMQGSSLPSVADFARRHKLFSLKQAEATPVRSLGEIVAAQIAEADRLIATGSRGRLDSQSIFFLLFLGLGLKQMWRGQIMQPAIPLLWRAMEILKDLNPPQGK